MSRPKVETARLMLDAVNRGDVDVAVALTSPEVVFEPLRAPVSGTYRGHEGIRRFFADTAETFETFRLDLSEIRDLGDDRVLGIGTMRARVKLGALETEVASAGIGTFRDGLLIHWKDFGNREQALAAADASP
jgi:ketosteroid isomerase-like protein